MTVHVDLAPEHDGIEVVTLDRPERRNALDHTTLMELRAAVLGAPDAAHGCWC